MALLDVTTATMANQALNFLVTGDSPTRMGNAHPNIVPYEAFEASDMYLIVAVGNDGQFTRYVEAAGQPELATDARFSTNAKRVENRDVLIPIIKDFMKQKTGQEWIDALEKVGVPCGPLNNMEQGVCASAGPGARYADGAGSSISRFSASGCQPDQIFW